jgi:two-component system sensor histidine kinase TctE
MSRGGFAERIEVAGHDEISELSSTLNEMASRIRSLLDRDKEFVVAASHQLRTPLTVIKIRLDEIWATEPPRDPQVAQYLHEIGDEVDRLTDLTSRLLELSEVESARQARSLPAFAAIVEAVERVRPLATHKDIAIRLRDETRGAQIFAPEGVFEEVVLNVLDNAVKYSCEAGPVDVLARVENGSLLVEVEDCGPGIPAELSERVFEPFYRAGSDRDGHGLGLTICARLCEFVGATLAVDRRPQGGTVARLAFPVVTSHG